MSYLQGCFALIYNNTSRQTLNKTQRMRQKGNDILNNQTKGRTNIGRGQTDTNSRLIDIWMGTEGVCGGYTPNTGRMWRGLHRWGWNIWDRLAQTRMALRWHTPSLVTTLPTLIYVFFSFPNHASHKVRVCNLASDIDHSWRNILAEGDG